MKQFKKYINPYIFFVHIFFAPQKSPKKLRPPKKTQRRNSYSSSIQSGSL